MLNVISNLKPFDLVDLEFLPLTIGLFEEGKGIRNTLGVLITQPCSILIGPFEHDVKGTRRAANRHTSGRRFEPQSGHFGATAGGGAKVQQTRIRTNAYKPGIGCITIGPLAVLPPPCVPTACSLFSKNF